MHKNDHKNRNMSYFDFLMVYCNLYVIMVQIIYNLSS